MGSRTPNLGRGNLAKGLPSSVRKPRCGAPDFSCAYKLPGAGGQAAGSPVVLANVSYLVPDPTRRRTCAAAG
jgi:hypothetical protein